MASKSNCGLLLLAAVVVSVFAAATATSEYYCYPGMGIPAVPLPSCREYVAHQTCGAGILGAPSLPISTMKERCCLELSQIRQLCRCEALGEFAGRKAPSDVGGLKDLPGCPWEPQRDFARVLVTPAQCNLETVYNTRYCFGID